jgi:pyruvate/2-oxoglutarate dehydrogenase complex dihydrolipoamide acyltransferase (E2) component
MEFHVPAPKQGLLVEWFVEHGAVIENMDSLARIVCEGAEAAVPAAIPARLG